MEGVPTAKDGFVGAQATNPPITLEGAAWTGFGIPGAGEISVLGDYAYVAPGEGDLQVVGIRDKSNPTIVGHLAVTFVGRVDVDGKHAFLQHPEAIFPVDITDPTNPQYLSRNVDDTVVEVEGGCLAEARARNGYLFLAQHAEVGGDPLPCEPTVDLVDDFVVLDVSDLLNFTQVAHLNLDSGAISLFLDGDNAYVGLVSGGVAVVDIANPTAPVLRGTYRGEPGETHAPYLLGHHGSTLVMATWNPVVLDFDAHGEGSFMSPDPVEVIVVDASDPANPVRRGHYEIGDGPAFPLPSKGHSFCPDGQMSMSPFRS